MEYSKGLKKVDVYILEALNSHLHNNRNVHWNEDITIEEWKKIFEKASNHHILPMIYQAVFSCDSFFPLKEKINSLYKKQVMQDVFLQTRKTDEFIKLYKYLVEHGITPIVIKGIICRQIYPVPDYRLSGDEDIVVSWEEYRKCHKVLTEYGMEVVQSREQNNQENLNDIYLMDEVSYGKKGSPLYIEVHKELFAIDSEAYSDFNILFNGFRERKISVQLEGIKIDTLNHNEHLLYLILHAFKHFLHSGFGIRQICDIMLFAYTYSENIDWEYILQQCKKVRAETFALAITNIGKNCFNYNLLDDDLIEEWMDSNVNAIDLLEDVLSGGVYGAVDEDRLHSSNITLNAVVSNKKEKKERFYSILKTLFPSRTSLKKRFIWLNRYPYLLPLAWILRFTRYYHEAKGMRKAIESLRIGNKRKELLRKYKIIDK